MNPWAILGALAAAASIFAGGWWASTQWHDGDVAKSQLACEQGKNAALAEAQRELNRRQGLADNARKALTDERKAIAARDADSARKLDGLRERLLANADAPESLAACRAVARDYAAVLGEGADVVREGRRAVETRDAEVKALFEGAAP